MVGYGKTDVGLVRCNNEDAIFVSNEPVGALPNLYIVSDGMGGHNAGEIASGKGISFFCDMLSKTGGEHSSADVLDMLVEGVIQTNRMVYELSRSKDCFNGMGATFSVGVIFGRKLYGAHVGDSRVYIIKPARSGSASITQISSDHTFVNEMVKAGEITKEQAKTHPQRNIVTRALGINLDVNVDGIVADIEFGDFLLICSDGLSNKITETDMLDITLSHNDIETKCGELVELAKQNGGEDNISAILVWVNEVTA